MISKMSKWKIQHTVSCKNAYLYVCCLCFFIIRSTTNRNNQKKYQFLLIIRRKTSQNKDIFDMFYLLTHTHTGAHTHVSIGI